MRVWVPACATGEEAYSIAMLLLEHARKLDAPPALQVFATDLDEEAIQTGARRRSIPQAIAADVSEERLRRFFVKEHRGYRVRARAARDGAVRRARPAEGLAVLAPGPGLLPQPADLPEPRRAGAGRSRSFHFALQPDGRLFLGSSESVDDGQPAVSRARQEAPHLRAAARARAAAAGAGGAERRCCGRSQAQEQARAAPVVHGKRFVQDAARVLRRSARRQPGPRRRWRELHFKLLERSRRRRCSSTPSTRSCTCREHAGTLPAVRRRRADDATCCASCTRRCASSCARRCSARARAASAAESRPTCRSRSTARPALSTSASSPAERHRAGHSCSWSSTRRATRPRRRRTPPAVPAAAEPSRVRHLERELEQLEGAPARHRRAVRSLHRGAEGQQRRAAGDERGAALGDRGAGDQPRGAAVDQRGADHRQPGAEEQGRRARPRQQRPAEPDGRDRHRHGLPRPRAAHHALHAERGAPVQPDSRRHRPAAGRPAAPAGLSRS